MSAENAVVDTGSLVHAGTQEVLNGVPAPLNGGENLICKRLIVQAAHDLGQGVVIAVGSETDQTIDLVAASGPLYIEIDNVCKVWVTAVGGDGDVNWMATGNPGRN